ncbi:hypothetical protein CKAH01_13090 [Colletotrichum kahawae]|uniref:Uncharacterized protein n=1 Tax=Colletotrichum kahawae TaxID=34407 RepID=A0AAD9YTM9_COLKA|nr:hypothetical protein CKAH01_13090 [Colletotrichum kahawae]
MVYLQASTWRTLGLSVAASYATLGALDVFLPYRAGYEFFGLPPSDAVAQLMPLLGIRDLAIAGALFALARQGKGPEMGTVILAGTILCVWDAVAIWQAKGPKLGGTIAAGVVFVTGIGAGLLWS